MIAECSRSDAIVIVTLQRSMRGYRRKPFNNEIYALQDITIIGAGLAGCEAAWQAAERGVRVTLHEMKPLTYSPAHQLEGLAELVCSNSLRGESLENAVGLLKEELRRGGSLFMEAADATRVPAGGALAVDRELFSRYITDKITSHPLIELVRGEVTDYSRSRTGGHRFRPADEQRAGRQHQRVDRTRISTFTMPLHRSSPPIPLTSARRSAPPATARGMGTTTSTAR